MRLANFHARPAAALILSLSVACSRDMTAPRPGTDARVADIAFCGAPDWVAFQDGDGAWTRATPTSAGAVTSFHRVFATDRAAVAVGRAVGGGLSVMSVLYGTPSELSILDDTAGVACGNTGFKTLRGTVIGIDESDVVRLNAGRGADGAFVSIGTGPDFTIRGLVAGPHDILATRLRRVGDHSTLNSIILRRTADLPDAATLQPMDFTSAEAFAPAIHTLTVVGPDADAATGFIGLRTTHGIADELSTVITAAADGIPYPAIPDEHLEAGDLQSISMTSRPSPAGVVRGATTYFHSPRDRTITFGGMPTAPVITVASSATALRMRARFAVDRDYDRVTTIAYQQGQSTVVAVRMTAAYAAANPGGYDLLVPDLTGVDGFDPRWALQPGQPLLWTAVRFGGTLGVGLNAVPVDGSTSFAATQGGTFNP